MLKMFKALARAGAAFAIAASAPAATVKCSRVVLALVGGGVPFGCATTVTPTLTPTPVPIPELARWEAQMLTYGQAHCASIDDPRLDYDQRLGNTYYDAIRVFHQIAAYTGDPKWNDCIAKARTIFRGWVEGSPNVPGYWNATTGLRMDWERLGEARSRAAAIAMSQNAAFARDGTPLEWTASAYSARDVSYAIVSYLDAEALGEPRRARLAQLLDQAFGHIDQWFISKSYRAPREIAEYVPGAAGQYYIAPFMVGLELQALIRWWDVSHDARVLPAVKTALDTLWARAWVTADESFWYQDWVSDPSATFPPQPGAPDLNLIIAPAFAWVYQQTGDTVYRDRGDKVFAGGVKRAWLDGGKQFNQNYVFSFDYVKFRKQ